MPLRALRAAAATRFRHVAALPDIFDATFSPRCFFEARRVYAAMPRRHLPCRYAQRVPPDDAAACRRHMLRWRTPYAMPRQMLLLPAR